MTPAPSFKLAASVGFAAANYERRRKDADLLNISYDMIDQLLRLEVSKLLDDYFVNLSGGVPVELILRTDISKEQFDVMPTHGDGFVPGPQTENPTP